jgi:hypothetical protein
MLCVTPVAFGTSPCPIEDGAANNIRTQVPLLHVSCFIMPAEDEND